jgi:spermidine/putrescine transport system permease protein
VPDASRSLSDCSTQRLLFDWRRTPGLGVVVSIVLTFLYLPMAILSAYAFNANRVVTVWSGFSLHWFWAVLQNEDLQRAALNSIVVAVAASMVATLAALGAALALHIGVNRRVQALVTAIINLPLIVPEIVVSVTTLVLFANLNMHHGLSNLIVGHTVFCIPYAFLPIRSQLARLDRHLEDVARDLYASEANIYRFVVLPLLTPALFSGLVLAFVTSLDDFLISMMVARAGDTTLPVYVYGMMKIGITPEVNAISTLIVLVPTILFSCLIILFRGRLFAFPIDLNKLDNGDLS